MIDEHIYEWNEKTISIDDMITTKMGMIYNFRL